LPNQNIQRGRGKDNDIRRFAVAVIDLRLDAPGRMSATEHNPPEDFAP
jgi:hypothetical protein